MSPALEWNDQLHVKRHHQTSCYQIRNCQGEDEARVDGLPQGSGAQYDHTNYDISQQRSDNDDDVNYGKCDYNWWDIKIVNGWRGSQVYRIFWLIHGEKNLSTLLGLQKTEILLAVTITNIHTSTSIWLAETRMEGCMHKTRLYFFLQCGIFADSFNLLNKFGKCQLILSTGNQEWSQMKA